MAPTPSGGCTRTKLTKVKVPMNANRMQKPMAKLARKGGFFRCMIQASKCERMLGPRSHRRRLLDGEIDQHRAEQIEHGEEVEIAGEAEMVGDARRDQPADEIAGDIAGDVGGERTRRNPAAL